MNKTIKTIDGIGKQPKGIHSKRIVSFFLVLMMVVSMFVTSPITISAATYGMSSGDITAVTYDFVGATPSVTVNKRLHVSSGHGLLIGGHPTAYYLGVPTGSNGTSYSQPNPIEMLAVCGQYEGEINRIMYTAPHPTLSSSLSVYQNGLKGTSTYGMDMSIQVGNNGVIDDLTGVTIVWSDITSLIDRITIEKAEKAVQAALWYFTQGWQLDENDTDADTYAFYRALIRSAKARAGTKSYATLEIEESAPGIVTVNDDHYYGPFRVTRAVHTANNAINITAKFEDIFFDLQGGGGIGLAVKNGTTFSDLATKDMYGTGSNKPYLPGSNYVPGQTTKSDEIYIKLTAGDITELNGVVIKAITSFDNTGTGHVGSAPQPIFLASNGFPAMASIACSCAQVLNASNEIRIGGYRFTGTKTTNGQTLTDGQFSFSVYSINSAEYGAAYQNINLAGKTKVAAGTNAADGTITFDPIPCFNKNVGQSYYYAIVEDQTPQSGWTLDPKVYFCKIDVTKDASGAIVATRSDSGGAITFSNTKDGVTPVYDAALQKWVVSYGAATGEETATAGDSNTVPNIVKPQVNIGDKVKFGIKVINQGTTEVTINDISDYMPKGYTFEAAGNTGWSVDEFWAEKSANSELTRLKYTTPITLSGGSTQTIYLTLTVSADAVSGNLENAAEISAMNQEDKDSTPDTDPKNDTVKDNEINEDAKVNPGVDDEDDHDIAEVTIRPIYDAALVKWIISVKDVPNGEDSTNTPNTLKPIVQVGDKVVFGIRLINQGNVPVIITEVSDYMPEGYSFYPSDNLGWTEVPDADWTHHVEGLTKLKYTPQTPLEIEVGEFVDIKLTLEVNDSGSLLNAAEISGMEDDDEDSTPDDNPGNDGPVEDNEVENKNGDEDDHDTAESSREYDAALVKWVISVEGADGTVAKTEDDSDTVPNTEVPYAEVGDAVRFGIRVINQGSTAIKITEIIDYIPAGYSFNAADNTGSGWAVDGAVLKWTGDISLNGSPMTSTSDDEFEDIYLTLRVEKTGSLYNMAEIFTMTDKNGKEVEDKDSTSDDNPGNDIVKDNEINEDAKANPGVDDEDDHDIAEVKRLYDAALQKWVISVEGEQSAPDSDVVPNTVKPVVETGDKVLFGIRVINQGATDLKIREIIDYIPAGYEFVLADQTDTRWGIVAGALKWTATETTAIELEGSPAGADDDFEDIYLILRVKKSGSLLNAAEITKMTDDEDEPVEDKDSTPNENPNDDKVVDNEVDDNENDEDDHDIAETERQYDAALQKWVVSVNGMLVKSDSLTTPNFLKPVVEPGSTVLFGIKVINQGTTDITITDISDYVPAGYSFDPNHSENAGWSVASGEGRLKYTTPISLEGSTLASSDDDDFAIIYLALKVNVTGSLVNLAEISEMKNDEGKIVADKDSTPDKDSNNDTLKDNVIDEDGKSDKRNDEDDHDVAEVKRPETPPTPTDTTTTKPEDTTTTRPEDTTTTRPEDTTTTRPEDTTTTKPEDTTTTKPEDTTTTRPEDTTVPEPELPRLPEMPDPNEPGSPDEFILIGNNGTPLGHYKKELQPDGSYMYVELGNTPLGWLTPQTSDDVVKLIIAILMSASMIGMVAFLTYQSKIRRKKAKR